MEKRKGVCFFMLKRNVARFLFLGLGMIPPKKDPKK